MRTRTTCASLFRGTLTRKAWFHLDGELVVVSIFGDINPAPTQYNFRHFCWGSGGLGTFTHTSSTIHFDLHSLAVLANSAPSINCNSAMISRFSINFREGFDVLKAWVRCLDAYSNTPAQACSNCVGHIGMEFLTPLLDSSVGQCPLDRAPRQRPNMRLPNHSSFFYPLHCRCYIWVGLLGSHKYLCLAEEHPKLFCKGYLKQRARQFQRHHCHFGE
jgi:hypothetical protein